MLVELRNKSSAVRVVYDTRSKPRTIGVGEKLKIDLPDTTLAHLRQAQARGARLEVHDVVKQDDVAPIPVGLTAAEVLERSSDLNYYQLLDAVKKVAPDSGLPARPTKVQMIGLLRTLSHTQHARELQQETSQ